MSSTPADIVREAAEKDSKAAVEVRSLAHASFRSN